MGAGVDKVDVVLIGGGIMSATVAALLNQLNPGLSIAVFERLDGLAQESAEPMNNAGTGHAANCELNYTPEKADGSVDIAKALTINGHFELSLQFWSHLVEKGLIPDSRAFCQPVPHLSFVWGEKNTHFLKTRHAALSAHPMFADMAYTEDPGLMKEWMPLVMEGREKGEPLAAHRVSRGTDLDFGRLTHFLFGGLEGRDGFSLHLGHEVKALHQEKDTRWTVTVRERATGATQELNAGFVFIGAGGGALPMLLKSHIPEGFGYGGFPVSGQWLVCTNPEVVERHGAKVYGKAMLGAPPMSVPHLDTRIIDGKKALLFGPYAGFTTKYLKHGSYLDLPASLRFHNLWPMTAAAWHNLDLTNYLVKEALQSHTSRVKALQHFVPTAKAEDWKLAIAGQRVQIVKGDPKQGGKLEFGTEVVNSKDGTLGALLGASPGASTAVATMSAMLLKCFAERAKAENWKARLAEIIPSFGQDLSEHPELLKTVRDRCNRVLGLG